VPNSLKELANQLLNNTRNRVQDTVAGKIKGLADDVISKVPYGDQLSQWAGIDRVAKLVRDNDADPASLQRFISLLKAEGIQTTDRFMVQFSKPQIDLPADTNAMVALSLLCEEASLPQHSLRTRTVKINGLESHRASGIDYHSDTITFGFYLQRTLRAKRFFENWMDGIVSPVTREIAFYNDYTADVEMTILDKSNSPVFKIKLMECFPRSVEAIPLSFGSHQAMKLQVKMAFNKWVAVKHTEDSIMQAGDSLVDQADNSFLGNLERQAINGMRDIGIRTATQKIGGPIVGAVNKILSRTR
jgi:hypothetical protein